MTKIKKSFYVIETYLTSCQDMNLRLRAMDFVKNALKQSNQIFSETGELLEITRYLDIVESILIL